jgi:tRNA nucleotidyltransferase/poly(A) polymerase
MSDLPKKVAATFMLDLLVDRKARVASAHTMEEAFGQFDELVDAISDEPEMMGDVIESLVNMGDLRYEDGAFYYKDGLKLGSQGRPVLADKHKQSIALMRFLSNVASKYGVGEHVYVVGGAVRNFVIDRPIKDIDVVIDSVALDGKGSEWFAKALEKAIPATTSLQTNQYGVAILTVNEEWLLDGTNLQGEVIEIANARKESYGGEEGKGYKPHMVEPSTIEEDIERREFTFNTLLWQLSELAQGPDKAEIIDLTGCGLDDLEEGVMKCPSDPDKTFSDDPTRMLRAVKFMVKYGFRIDPIVEDAIRRNAQKLKQAPQNAISEILINDILQMSQSKKTLSVLKELGLLDVVAQMLEKDKAFRKTLANWASRDAKILFLFDMMEIGLPLHSRLRFLDDAQMARLRQVAIELDAKEADSFVDLLKQPGRQMDTRELLTEFDLQGPEIRNLMGTARDVLLEQPSLRKSPRKLTEAVQNRYRSRISKVAGYYDIPKKKPTIEEVVRLWMEGHKGLDAKIHGYYDVRELWPLREYTWDRDSARGGMMNIDGEWKDLRGPQKWDALKADMKKNGWRKEEQPLILQVGKDGKAKVSEGNHRLALARELRMRKVPVMFDFRTSVSGGKTVVDDSPSVDDLLDQMGF